NEQALALALDTDLQVLQVTLARGARNAGCLDRAAAWLTANVESAGAGLHDDVPNAVHGCLSRAIGAKAAIIVGCVDGERQEQAQQVGWRLHGLPFYKCLISAALDAARASKVALRNH